MAWENIEILRRFRGRKGRWVCICEEDRGGIFFAGRLRWQVTTASHVACSSPYFSIVMTSGSTWRVPSGIPVVDIPAFDQILELDDGDDEHIYSKDMIRLYFGQATAFADMDAALAAAAVDMRTLADRAHFLMGSSAALGVARVAAVCAEIEKVCEASLAADAERAAGADDSEATDSNDDADSRQATLKQIAELLEEGKGEYKDAERWFRNWYAEHGQGFDEELEGPKADDEEGGAVAVSIEKSPVEVDAPRPTDAAVPTRHRTPPIELQSHNAPISV
ncbi:hypothetical protein K438DRAFT_1812722 [Mycena galopus ATCC 62051]|nr:hypothetical protein K438DRAFT_1812722 [Mycena galopus ATCC 62051]